MSVTSAPGFVASGLHAGIKRRRHDMAMIATEDRASVTTVGVFTQNKFVAPPVVLSRDTLSDGDGTASAIIVNSGNANAGTGARGMDDAKAMQSETAKQLGIEASQVLVCSTGVIGEYLPMEKLSAGIPRLAGELAREGGTAAATGILTTDHATKQAVVKGSNFTLGGMAKGCGMIAPNMATMLAFLTTDAELPRETLQALLREASDRTFNTLNVDGATSTNDTVCLMANGRAGPVNPAEFADALNGLCEELTLAMARDAEGVTKIARVTVTGAADNGEARQAAKAIAENNLVKCSWYSAEPYWGRLLAAVGACGVAFDPDASHVAYDGVTVAKSGTHADHDEDRVAQHMEQDEFHIEIGLGAGSGEAQVIGIDLGPGYIKENSVTT